MGKIDVNYNDMIKKAGQLDDLADELSKVLKEYVESANQGIHGVWKGTGADLYRKKMNEFQSVMNKRIKTLRNSASGLRRSAKAYKKVEEIGKALWHF